MEITKGIIKKAVKVVIYGPEGIGKSTLASRFPEPVFIDTEGSTSSMDVARLPKPTSWTMLLSEVDYVKSNPTCCRTLVIDTADWAEQLCSSQVCASHHIDGIEDLGYGKGYVYLKEEFGRLLNKASDLLDLGINVVITAHAMMRKFEQPDELGAYDRWELKLSKQCAPLLKEWSDMLLFCNYKTLVVNVDNKGASKGKNKAQGGRRVIYTQHHPCWDAKNRFGLPDEIDMDYEYLRPVIEGTQGARPERPVSEAPAEPAAASPVTAAASPAPVQTETKPEPEHAAPASYTIGNNQQISMKDMEHIRNGDTIVTPPDPVKEPEQPSAEEQQPEAAETPPNTAADDRQPPKISSMFSDPEKIPKNLRDLMEQDGITEWDLQGVVQTKGFYPENTLLQDMDPEFLQGWVVAYWPQVKELALKIRDSETIPFEA